MPFERPSLEKITNRINADLEARLKVSQLRRSDAKVYAQVLAGISHGLHGFIEYIAKQLFFDSAEGEFLDHWGSIFGIYRKSASKATGEVAFVFTGEDAVEIPMGSILQSETGQQYQTTSPAVGSIVHVEALVAGTAGNLSSGERLSLISTILGVQSAVASNGIGGGAEKENDDSLRTRLLARVRERPHAGTKADYEAWALEVPGVTRAWVYPLEGGDGNVVVRFVCDGLTNIIPDAQIIEKVQNHLDEERPVTARVKVYAPSAQKINFTISNLEPENETVKARIQEALISLFQQESAPGKRLYLSHIRAAISGAAGEVDHTLVSPDADIVPKTGVLPMVGDITWR